MKHLINFTLFLIIIFVVGCNSYEFVPPEKQTTAKNIEGLKKYFYENTSGYVYIPNSEMNKSANLYSNSIKLYPKWEDYSLTSYKDITCIELPVYSTDLNSSENIKSQNVSPPPSSHSRLVIYNSSEADETYGFIMTVIADDSYLSKGKDVRSIDYFNRDNEFSGIVVFNDMNGNFVNGWQYSNGEIKDGFIPAIKNSSSLKSAKVVDIVSVRSCWDVYTGLSEDQLEFSHRICNTQHIPVFYFTKTFDDMGGGGSFSDIYLTPGSSGGGYLPLDPVKRPLTETERITLNDVIVEFNSFHCLNQAISDFLDNADVSLKFDIDPDIPHDGNAAYNPETKTISFLNEDEITFKNLWEEMFHAYQDAYYPGGTSQYNDEGSLNIEFEAKVFKDLLSFVCCFALHADNNDPIYKEIEGKYNFEFLTAIRTTKNIDQGEYAKYIEYFGTYNTQYDHAIYSDALESPDALINLLEQNLNSSCKFN